MRIHAKTPDRLLHYIAEVVKDGKGFPKLLNDEMVIPFYLANGATLKEALDWTISGCCENRLINRETNVTGNGGINYGSVVEMTFRNGKLKVFKDLQFGVQTGDPRSWKNYDDVWKAFCTQLEHMAKHALIQQHVALRMKSQYFAAPATSMLHDLAMSECRDLHTHGDYISGAIDHGCFEAIGKATAVDSLAAVKHLIFDTKKLTWDQLLTAIENNWEGHEAIRQMCLNAPKIWQRNRVGGCHRLRDRAIRTGVSAQASQASQPGLPAAPDPDHVPCSDGQGDLGHAQWKEGKRVSLRRDLGLTRHGREGTDGLAQLHGQG